MQNPEWGIYYINTASLYQTYKTIKALSQRYKPQKEL
jgi:hypothetical protein